MSWHALPNELHEAVLRCCLAERTHTGAGSSSSSVLSLLLVSRQLHELFVPLLYAHLHLGSLAQLRKLVAAAGGVDAFDDDDEDEEEIDVSPSPNTLRAHLASHTRRLTISIDGVPGAGAAAPSSAAQAHDSPFRLWSGQPRAISSDERLALAVCVLRLCNPERLAHISLEMFGVRSRASLGEPALEAALGRLTALRSFRWVPPGRTSIVGFSIAVVDSALPSIQRGLLSSALRTPTQQSTLRELHFAAAGLPSQTAPDEADTRLDFLWAFSCQHSSTARALFPHLTSLRFTSAVNLPAAPLARLLLQRALAAHVAPNGTEPLRVQIADGFVGSIWGPRLSCGAIESEMRTLLLRHGCASALCEHAAAPPPSALPRVRVLSEALDYLPQVQEPSFAACAAMSQREIEALIESALDMLHLTVLEGAIAGRTQ